MKINKLYIIPIVISIISLCVSIIRIQPITFLDWNIPMFCIGVLGILVTLLVGWQIYTFINITEKIKSINVFKEDIYNRIKETEKDIHDESIDNMGYNYGLMMSMIQVNPLKTFMYLFKAHYENIGKKNLAESLSYTLILKTLQDPAMNFEYVKIMIKDVPFEEVEAFTHRALNEVPLESVELRTLIKKLLKETE